MTDIQNKPQDTKIPTTKVVAAETAKVMAPSSVAEPKAATETKTESK